jgi:anthranilate synthase component 2
MLPKSSDMILVLDNYDSFTYNLVHMIRELGFGSNMTILRNDKITVEDVNNFEKILLSPGPGIPKDAGIMPELLSTYAATKSILGVCLGHQAIGENFGGSLINMKNVLHGVVTQIEHERTDNLFSGIPEKFKACRYHSWIVDRATLPDELVVTATDKKGTIMAMMHKELDVRGVQFHPESVMTEFGMQMIKNWLN